MDKMESYISCNIASALPQLPESAENKSHDRLSSSLCFAPQDLPHNVASPQCKWLVLCSHLRPFFKVKRHSKLISSVACARRMRPGVTKKLLRRTHSYRILMAVCSSRCLGTVDVVRTKHADKEWPGITW
jgi:hypothetical protein